MTKYNVLSNIGFTVKSTWQADKILLIWVFAGTFVRILFPFAGIITPRIVIDEIVAGAGRQRFITVMAVMALVLVVIHFVHGYVRNKINQHTRRVAATDFTVKHSRKLLTMDYANLEKPDSIKLNNKTTQNVYNNDGADFFLATLSGLSENIGGLVLFGGVIAMVHPLILVLLGISVVINGFLHRRHRKFDEGRREYVGKTNKKKYTARWVLSQRPFAQDIRVYSMVGWLRGRWEEPLLAVRASDIKSAKMGMTSGLADSFMVLVRDGAAYAFLTYLLLADRIGLGEFVMLFAAIGGMAAWINGILTNGTGLFRCSVNVSDRRETLEYPDKEGKQRPVEGTEKAPEIRLSNVSYTYPAADVPAIKNISLTIKPGERLAIVGVNGAGKTTLIKLICGFYSPADGEIFYNGTNIGELDKNDYLSAVTAVFQRIYIMPESIAVNIAQDNNPHMEKVRSCLIKAGLWEKVKTLENGPETNLVREVNEDAAELSGGELQKLALARALYKDATLIILDEPTAALDPIAESEMYRQYASLTEGKTSIYISHRLASTRFCDRIILLDGNTIAEEGTHDELMSKNGKYAEMFATQASYYNDAGARLSPGGAA
ncbi:MAG: ABC transporter ATP-binding protein/permease [Defluviitaleaceae bacterium]|nr:ABC transporter ATP-binding protein/permease [Defluviitaleaceae bacterium]